MLESAKVGMKRKRTDDNDNDDDDEKFKKLFKSSFCF
jgi:hypothetical protein